MDLFCLICVYAGTAGNVEHGDQYQLKLVYEHNLQRTACNMTYGTFGGVTGKDDDVKPLHLSACCNWDGIVFCQTTFANLPSQLHKRAQLTDLDVSLVFIYKHNLRSFVVVRSGEIWKASWTHTGMFVHSWGWVDNDWNFGLTIPLRETFSLRFMLKFWLQHVVLMFNVCFSGPRKALCQWRSSQV